LRGGHGYNATGGDCAGGGKGGIGLHAINSSVATYRAPMYGGDGGNAYDYGGDGGAGCALQSSTLFASGCAFQGGIGGSTLDNFYVTYGGNGGDGIDLADAAAHAGLLDDTFIPGAGGIANGLPANSGSPGQSIAGPGTSQMFIGPQRTLTASTRIISDATSLALTVKGASGDTVFLSSATRPGFSSPANTVGPFLLHTPTPISTDPVGTIPASGVLSLTVPIALLDANAVQRIDHFQVACVSTSGQHYLTGTASVEVLDPARPPDCDGNGVNDYLDTISGAVLDCDHNLRPDVCDPDCDGNGVADGCEIATHAQLDCNANHIPDNCELAAGTSFDCNGNGVLDQCDIANGSSQDQNHNGIPDECEGPHIWYVDAAAAAGGNGSSASPFNNLADAFSISVTHDTIRVRDGLYHGPKNRDLDFMARDLVVESVNGSANCILELQLQGRAFIVNDAQTFASRIEGFTIRHGNSAGSNSSGGAIYAHWGSLTIRNCVFESCQAPNYGGAIEFAGGCVIEACVFRQNTAMFGGALGCTSDIGSAVRISRCTFDSNSSLYGGGAVNIYGAMQVSISHCSFFANSSEEGGALYSNVFSIEPGVITSVDDCLFAGNTATRGGAVCITSNNTLSKAKITQSTFTANASTSNGGALSNFDYTDVRVASSIFWANSSPQGHELACLGSQARLAVSWSDAQGGLTDVFAAQGGVVSWSASNINADPLFVDPDGPDNNPATFDDNDYRLSLVSPCIDAADNTQIPPDANDIDNDGDVNEPTPLDLALMPRRQDIPSVPDTGSGLPPIVDMGCYERQP
jgi:predicted outer membrane repeat protein